MNALSETVTRCQLKVVQLYTRRAREALANAHEARAQGLNQAMTNYVKDARTWRRFARAWAAKARNTSHTRVTAGALNRTEVRHV